MAEEKNISDQKSEDKADGKGQSQPEPQPQTSALPTGQAGVEPQNTTMEVHKHPHHVTHKKKWGEYLVEFAMLFLAVFLGFLAENWREHIVENKREKQYIKSFYEDLTDDERDLQLNIDFLTAQMRQADTLQQLMLSVDVKQPANRIYMYLRGITRGSAGRLNPNDRTIIQLRNAGGMRLIKNKSVSDSMVGYYRTAETIQFLTEDALISKRFLREKYMPLLNAADFFKVIDSTTTIVNVPETLYLRKADPEIINECLIEIDRIKTINLTLARRIQFLKEKAGRIKEFIKREYHLKNE
jgi:hypothetical protein